MNTLRTSGPRGVPDDPAGEDTVALVGTRCRGGGVPVPVQWVVVGVLYGTLHCLSGPLGTILCLSGSLGTLHWPLWPLLSNAASLA